MGNEKNRTCVECGGSLRIIKKSGQITGETLCLSCNQPIKNICPFCKSSLRTPLAQQCPKCKRSWHCELNEINNTYIYNEAKNIHPLSSMSAEKLEEIELLKTLINQEEYLHMQDTLITVHNRVQYLVDVKKRNSNSQFTIAFISISAVVILAFTFYNIFYDAYLLYFVLVLFFVLFLPPIISGIFYKRMIKKEFESLFRQKEEEALAIILMRILPNDAEGAMESLRDNMGYPKTSEFKCSKCKNDIDEKKIYHTARIVKCEHCGSELYIPPLQRCIKCNRNGVKLIAWNRQNSTNKQKSNIKQQYTAGGGLMGGVTGAVVASVTGDIVDGIVEGAVDLGKALKKANFKGFFCGECKNEWAMELPLEKDKNIWNSVIYFVEVNKRCQGK